MDSDGQRHLLQPHTGRAGLAHTGTDLSGSYLPRFVPPMTTVPAEGHPPSISRSPTSSPRFAFASRGLALPVVRFTGSIVSLRCVCWGRRPSS